MWDLATTCLETAELRGAKYADVRVMHLRQRDLTTKNGQVGTLAQSESIGLGVRVLGQRRVGICVDGQADARRRFRAARRKRSRSRKLRRLRSAKKS